MAKRKQITSTSTPARVDFLLLDHDGEDPRPCLQLPEVDGECGRMATELLDSAAIVYDNAAGETDDGQEIESGFVAVLCIVARGPTAEDAATAIVAGSAHIASELLGAHAKGGRRG